ncbi:MAG: hypothetical protein V9G19_19485 [Tetrasphaera sp.]
MMVGERSLEDLHRLAEARAQAIPNCTSETLAGQDHLASEKLLAPSLERLLLRLSHQEYAVEPP